MTHESSWKDLKKTWQSAAPDVDVHALHKRARRKQWRMIALQTLEAVATVGMSFYLIVVGLPGELHAGPFLNWLLLIPLWLEFLVKTGARLRTWRPPTRTTVDLLRLNRQRARTGLVFVWTTLLAMLTVYGFFTPAVTRLWTSSDPALHDAAVASTVANGIFFVLVIAWALWYGPRQRRTLHQTRALLRELSNDVPPRSKV